MNIRGVFFTASVSKALIKRMMGASPLALIKSSVSGTNRQGWLNPSHRPSLPPFPWLPEESLWCQTQTAVKLFGTDRLHTESAALKTLHFHNGFCGRPSLLQKLMFFLCPQPRHKTLGKNQRVSGSSQCTRNGFRERVVDRFLGHIILLRILSGLPAPKNKGLMYSKNCWPVRASPAIQVFPAF